MVNVTYDEFLEKKDITLDELKIRKIFNALCEMNTFEPKLSRRLYNCLCFLAKERGLSMLFVINDVYTTFWNTGSMPNMKRHKKEVV